MTTFVVENQNPDGFNDLGHVPGYRVYGGITAVTYPMGAIRAAARAVRA